MLSREPSGTDIKLDLPFKTSFLYSFLLEEVCFCFVTVASPRDSSNYGSGRGSNRRMHARKSHMNKVSGIKGNQRVVIFYGPAYENTTTDVNVNKHKENREKETKHERNVCGEHCPTFDWLPSEVASDVTMISSEQ